VHGKEISHGFDDIEYCVGEPNKDGLRIRSISDEQRRGEVQHDRGLDWSNRALDLVPRGKSYIASDAETSSKAEINFESANGLSLRYLPRSSFAAGAFPAGRAISHVFNNLNPWLAGGSFGKDLERG
jgi:hypothetical protein